MTLTEFILEALDREQQSLLKEVSDLTPAELAVRIGPVANPIGWTLWHMTRVEDMWIQFFAQNKLELWESEGWYTKSGLPTRDTGFGHTPAQVAAFPNLALPFMLDYFQAVRPSTIAYLKALSPEGFKRVPRERRPDMNVGSMFRQIVNELNQHLGQIAYIKGILRSQAGKTPTA